MSVIFSMFFLLLDEVKVFKLEFIFNNLFSNVNIYLKLTSLASRFSFPGLF